MAEDSSNVLRSEDMSLVQMFVSTEAAHDMVYELGQLGLVQFRDLNPTVNPFQRSFIGEIRRIEEMSRLLRLFNSYIQTEGVAVRSLDESPLFLATGMGAPRRLDELEAALAEHDQRLAQINQTFQQLGNNARELLEAQHVLRETAVFFDVFHTADIRRSIDDASAPLLLDHGRDDLEGQYRSEGSSDQFEMEFLAGTIDRGRLSTFERLLWRLLRGNIYFKHAAIDQPFVDPISGEETRKDVFIVFTHGASLVRKVQQLAESMDATLFPIDSNSQKRSDALRDVTTRLEDLQIVLHQTTETRLQHLSRLAENLRSWEDVIRREKLVCEALNLFDYDAGRRTLIAEGWVPTSEIPRIQLVLRDASEQWGSSHPPVLHVIPTNRIPPTFHRTNRLTVGFQTILDAYGISKYQEVNPGTLAISTFPFLFSVMFGDIGHAAIIFIFAIWMIMKERAFMKQELDPIFELFFAGRYIILLMGIFSLFSGFIYNDIFSLSLHLFQSGWDFHQDSNTSKWMGSAREHVYPFGLDPAWHEADNSLTFKNSYKMKLSVILGYFHMTLALCLQVPNYIKFNSKIDIFTMFLPQMLFFQSLFGYLVGCILYKWTVDWNALGREAPPLLTMFIDMFLAPGVVDPRFELYPGQAGVQVVLLWIAGICVPVMLCAKPFLVWRERRDREAAGYISLPNQASGVPENEEEEEEAEGAEASTSQDDGTAEEESFDDVIIHQIIHTVEFCINSISHTASYLRLWALSLAHSELSSLLWGKTLGSVLPFENWISVVASLPLVIVWLQATIAGLCGIEGVSAFLHTLRLHWVEGNSKHFIGGGYAFTPLTFAPDGSPP
ncbi:H+-ATPase subunit [Flagelloscypha sp. PMI_526]|nr:H+-ATPase subunit [Flagelloscypha sp. PMI_526]